MYNDMYCTSTAKFDALQECFHGSRTVDISSIIYLSIISCLFVCVSVYDGCGRGVTDFRVVCKIITCVSAFTFTELVYTCTCILLYGLS